MSRRHGERLLTLALVEASPLRTFDPRVRLLLSLCASLAVMLPLARLAAFCVLYALLLWWARLLPNALRQVWRLKWLLVLLFALDWWLVGTNLAAAVTLRLVLLAGAFALFSSTTTPSELRLALAWLRLPYRYAFSVSLAFQSLGLLSEEWRTIREAQQSRGAWRLRAGWRAWMEQLREAVALAVPVIVMASRRAWATTEAAYARGFDSPHRRPYHALRATARDWALTAVAIVGAAAVLTLR